MIENLLMYTCAKHCHKRWSSDKAIAKIKWCSFFCLTVYITYRHTDTQTNATETNTTPFRVKTSTPTKCQWSRMLRQQAASVKVSMRWIPNALCLVPGAWDLIGAYAAAKRSKGELCIGGEDESCEHLLYLISHSVMIPCGTCYIVTCQSFTRWSANT